MMIFDAKTTKLNLPEHILADVSQSAQKSIFCVNMHAVKI